MIQFYRGVARRLFKSRHNMIEGKILGVKALGESKVELPCRGNGEGWRNMPLSTISELFF